MKTLINIKGDRFEFYSSIADLPEERLFGFLINNKTVDSTDILKLLSKNTDKSDEFLNSFIVKDLVDLLNEFNMSYEAAEKSVLRSDDYTVPNDLSLCTWGQKLEAEQAVKEYQKDNDLKKLYKSFISIYITEDTFTREGEIKPFSDLQIFILGSFFLQKFASLIR